eukprot:scaffold62681_cov35-Phaeocystis_antarctica.AAC.1
MLWCTTTGSAHASNLNTQAQPAHHSYPTPIPSPTPTPSPSPTPNPNPQAQPAHHRLRAEGGRPRCFRLQAVRQHQGE